jgi:hypothetical protein
MSLTFPKSALLHRIEIRMAQNAFAEWLSALAEFTEACKQLAHFAGGVKIALRAGLFNACSQDGPCRFDFVFASQHLAEHEERGNIRRLARHQFAKNPFAFPHVSCAAMFHGHGIAQKNVARLLLQHHQQLFQSRHGAMILIRG